LVDRSFARKARVSQARAPTPFRRSNGATTFSGKFAEDSDFPNFTARRCARRRKRPLISRLYYKSPAPSLPYRRTKKKKFFPFSSSLQTAKPLLSAQAARRKVSPFAPKRSGDRQSRRKIVRNAPSQPFPKRAQKKSLQENLSIFSEVKKF
jgi:hypothetical protein